MKLYNTLTRKKEEFKPIKKGRASFYYCGPTVYWTQHIGNLRGSFCADILVRVFKYLDYRISYIRNYTDVGHLTSDQDTGEDKMEKAAKRERTDAEKIAQKYIKIYEDDARDLNFLEPDEKPRAGEHIQEIIEMIQGLLDKGYAYRTDLGIYFEVKKFKNYTDLSGQILDKNIKGAGAGDANDPRKKDSADFALWFFRTGAHKNALQFWPSPFESASVQNGEGFPGWHIECSAMCRKYLGDTIDIHMGGREHISVHHTNEIAQSEAVTGKKFVNYWLHNEHLLVDGKKMAKSEGTGYSLAEVKEKGFDPLDLRYLYLQAHYRSKLNFTFGALESAQAGLNSLKLKIKDLADSDFRATEKNINLDFKQKFIEAISDDLNTPKALAIARELLKSDIGNKEKIATILDFDKALGLDLKNISKQQGEEIPEKIKELTQKRQKAREAKNWEEADKLREEILEQGYLIEDKEGGEYQITRNI